MTRRVWVVARVVNEKLEVCGVAETRLEALSMCTPGTGAAARFEVGRDCTDVTEFEMVNLERPEGWTASVPTG